MKFTITFEADELPTGYGDIEATLEVIKDAIDYQLINLEVYPKCISLKVEQ